MDDYDLIIIGTGAGGGTLLHTLRNSGKKILVLERGVMATVLWKGGISFGGVIAFILADLVTVPMLMVYRKYYGLRTMWFLLITLTGCIFLTALLVDMGFGALCLKPKSPVGEMQDMSHAIVWSWQSWLNVIFIPLSLLYFFWGRRSMK